MYKIFESGNKHLENLTNKYFLSYAGIEEPKIGIYSFRDVESEFDSALEEYSKIDSSVIRLYESKSRIELLQLNNISDNDLTELKDYVNKILLSHRDENIKMATKYKIVFKQIDNYLDKAERTIYDIPDSDMNFPENKLTKIFYEKVIIQEANYINTIIELMNDAEVNQIKDNKYLVLEKILAENLRMLKLYSYVDSPKSEFRVKELQLKFRDKKKYLKSLKDDDKRLKALKDYKNELSQEYMYLFIWYIIYDMNKIDIYQINQVIGYRYNDMIKLYNYLFQLSHSTGRNEDFTHHTTIKTDDLTLFYLLHYLKN